MSYPKDCRMWPLTYPRIYVDLSISSFSLPLPLLIVSHVVFSPCVCLSPSFFTLPPFSSALSPHISLQTSFSPASLFLTLLSPPFDPNLKEMV